VVVVAHIITGITFVFTSDTIVIPLITFMQGIYKYMPENMPLGYIVLQLFCIYSL
jgi:hypothetical protein